jgi:hypothetical protein
MLVEDVFGGVMELQLFMRTASGVRTVVLKATLSMLVPSFQP